MTVVEQEVENVNSRTVQLVKILTEVGPDIPEISRRLGQFKESVRYRYKEKILNRGMAVQAAVGHEKLGLKRMMVIAEVANEYKNYANSIFAAMNDLCYVVGFNKTLVGGEHVIHISAPAEHTAQVRQFFAELKEMGFFSSLDMLEFDWFRNTPMKPEAYDFDTGRWDFDWQKQGEEDFKSAVFAPSSLTKFDYVDLQITKELQKDANKSLKEISDKLQLNYKKLAWHFATHVQARKMIPTFTVNWMGTRYDYSLEKVLHRRHRYFAVDFFVRDVSELELMKLRGEINKLPFLWGEAGGKNYFADFAFPVDYVVEGLQFLGNISQPVKDRMRLYPIDQTESARFTISYKLYDQAAKKWTFNVEDLSQKFGNLMMQIKEAAARQA